MLTFKICFRRLEYTRDTLIQFKQEMVMKEAQAKKGVADSGFGGGFGGGGFSDKSVSILFWSESFFK